MILETVRAFNLIKEPKSREAGIKWRNGLEDTHYVT